MHLWYFPGGGGGAGWVGEIINKDHLSLAGAGRLAELGNKTLSPNLGQQSKFIAKVQSQDLALA